MVSSGLPFGGISDNLIFSTSLKWSLLLVFVYHAHIGNYFANYLRFYQVQSGIPHGMAMKRLFLKYKVVYHME
jgi:hypothetical protein